MAARNASCRVSCWPGAPALRALAGIALGFAVTSSFAITRTWTGNGSDANWSTPGNWGAGIPVADDDLVFPAGAARLTTNNDFPADTGFNSISLGATGYMLTGNSVALGAGGLTLTNLSLFNNPATISLPLTLAAMRPVSMLGTTGAQLIVSGGTSGPGGFSATSGPGIQSTFALGGTNSFAGGVTVSDMFLVADSDSAFGTGSVTGDLHTTINPHGRTVPNAMFIQGFGNAGNAAINASGSLSGAITLTGNTGIGGASIPELDFTGPIIGAGDLTAPMNSDDSVVVLGGDSPGFTGVLRVGAGKLYVNALFANATANLTDGVAGATLAGTGGIGGAVSINTGRILAPGAAASTGVLSTGPLTLLAGSQLQVRLNGTVAAADYDQVNVTGTVELHGNLSVIPGFVPAVGNTFTIIDNDGGDAVTGTFAGLAEGAQLNVGGVTMTISYVGGTGNDVVLTVTGIPPGVSLAVNRTGSGGGTVTSGAPGISCGATCLATYPAGTVVVLTAASDAGSQFTGWLGGGCTGFAAPCSVTLNAATTVSATFALAGGAPYNFDVDENSPTPKVDALTDGLLILRYLFGLTGNSLTQGALAPDATRTSNIAVQGYLDDIRPLLDVDGNGQADALTDGLMLIRYFFGLRGNALTQSAIGAGAKRQSAMDIEPYIAGLVVP